MGILLNTLSFGVKRTRRPGELLARHLAAGTHDISCRVRWIQPEPSIEWDSDTGTNTQFLVLMKEYLVFAPEFHSHSRSDCIVHTVLYCISYLSS